MHRDKVLLHLEILGFQVNQEKTRLFAEDLFSRFGAGLGHHDRVPIQRARLANAELS